MDGLHLGLDGGHWGVDWVLDCALLRLCEHSDRIGIEGNNRLTACRGVAIGEPQPMRFVLVAPCWLSLQRKYCFEGYWDCQQRVLAIALIQCFGSALGGETRNWRSNNPPPPETGFVWRFVLWGKV